MNVTDTRPSEIADETESWRERLAYWAYATIAWLGENLPTRVGRPMFRALGSLAYRFGPASRRDIVLANQARVIGRPVDDPLVVASTREAYRRYARYWYDAFDVITWTDEQMLDAFEWDGAEYLLEPTQHGQGVIAVLPHMGNWDASGRAMRARGLPMVAVAEHLRPERLFRLFERQREAFGIRIIASRQERRDRQAAHRCDRRGKRGGLARRPRPHRPRDQSGDVRGHLSSAGRPGDARRFDRGARGPRRLIRDAHRVARARPPHRDARVDR